jgi:hypothetical protein
MSEKAGNSLKHAKKTVLDPGNKHCLGTFRDFPDSTFPLVLGFSRKIHQSIYSEKTNQI